jgi:hypothetical protein
MCQRVQPVCRNSHRNSQGIVTSLDAHHLTLAPQAHRLAWIDVFEYEGKLDDLPEGEDEVRLKEHSTGTEVTRDARPCRQLHTQRHLKSRGLPPF